MPTLLQKRSGNPVAKMLAKVREMRYEKAAKQKEQWDMRLSEALEKKQDADGPYISTK